MVQTGHEQQQQSNPEQAPAHRVFAGAGIEVGVHAEVAAWAAGGALEVAACRELFDEEAGQHQIVREEFGKMTPRRTYVAHGLPDKDVAAAAAKCVSIDGLGALYIVRMVLTRVEARPHLLVVGILKPKWWQFTSDASRQLKLRNALMSAVKFQERAMYYVPAQAKPWTRVLDKVSGSLVFRAAKR